LKYWDISIGMIDPGENSRQDLGDITGLIASINAIGMINPLTVERSDGTRFKVIAGARRFEALRQIHTDPGDRVPCMVRDADDMSNGYVHVLENTERLALTPLEEAHAFVQLIKHGDTPEEIAVVFGRGLRYVKQRIALGSLPAWCYEHEGWRLLDLQNLTRFNAEQLDQYKEILRTGQFPQAPWAINNPSSVLSQLRGHQGYRGDRALFDLDLYIGDIDEDLFSEDETRRLLDTEMFWELQTAEIEKRIEALKNDGWSMVTVFQGGYFDQDPESFIVDPIDRLPARQRKIVKELLKAANASEDWKDQDAVDNYMRKHVDKCRAFNKAERDKSGVAVFVDRNDGEVRFHEGVKISVLEDMISDVTTPEDIEGTDPATDTPSEKPAKKTAANHSVTQKAASVLQRVRHQLIAGELAKKSNRNILLRWTLASLFSTTGGNVVTHDFGARNVDVDAGEVKNHVEAAAAWGKLSAVIKSGAVAKIYDQLESLSEGKLIELLCIRLTESCHNERDYSASLEWPVKSGTYEAAIKKVEKDLDITPRDHWSPSEDFLAMFPKYVLLELGKGHKDWFSEARLAELAKLPKGKLVVHVAAHLATKGRNINILKM